MEWRGRGTDSQSHGCRIGRRCDDGNEIPLTWRVAKSPAIGLNPDHLRAILSRGETAIEEERPYTKPFLTDVKTLRDRARKTSGECGVSLYLQRDVDKGDTKFYRRSSPLNRLRAPFTRCHAIAATGLSSEGVKAEI